MIGRGPEAILLRRDKDTGDGDMIPAKLPASPLANEGRRSELMPVKPANEGRREDG